MKKFFVGAALFAVSAHSVLAQSIGMGGSSGGVQTLDPSVGINNAGSRVQLYGTAVAIIIGMVLAAMAARNPRNLGIVVGGTVGAVAAIWMFPGIPAMIGVVGNVFR